MIELFGQMLVGVSAAAICGGVAMLLAGGGALREVIRLAAGLAVLLAVLEPLSALRPPDLTRALRQSVRQAQQQRTAMQQEQQAALSASAADVTCRYIRERAAALGAACQAELTLDTNADGVLVVTGITLTCDRTDAATAQALETMVAEECGIPREMQTWNWNE